MDSSFLEKRKSLFNWAAWFFGGNILLFCLLGARYIAQIAPLSLTAPNFFNELLAWSFLILAAVGQLALLAWLPGFLLICVFILIHPLPNPPPSRGRGLIFILASFIATLSAVLLFIDTEVFALFRFHLNGVIWDMVLSGEAKQIFHFSSIEWLQIIIFFMGLFVLQIIYGYWLWRKQNSARPLRHGKQWLSLCLACLLLSYAMFLEAGVYPALSFTQQTYALPFYDNIFSKLLPMKNSLQKVVLLGAGNFVQPKQADRPLHYPLQPLIYQPPKKPLNVVMIVIDTWRFDMVDPQVTPHIHQFAQHTWQFHDHFSGGNSTQPGIFSLFYGLPGTYWTAMTEQHQGPVLIDALLQQHYQMGIFASAELLSPAFNKNVFLKINKLQTKTPGVTVYDRDRFITGEFKRFIEKTNQSQPFFTFVFYDAAHSYCDDGNLTKLFQPEIKVCNHLGLDNQSDPAPYRNRYKNALYFVDGLVAQDLAELKQRGLLGNTVVLLTGDHGNEFNDNHLGYWEHASNFTRYQVQTPLLVYWPGKAPAVINQLTSHYDIAPTLLKTVLGCQNPLRDYSIGNLLTAKVSPRHLLVSSYVDFGIREPDRITTILPTGNYAITDLVGHLLPRADLRTNILRQVFDEMNRYYF